MCFVLRRSLIVLLASALVAWVAPARAEAQPGDGVRPDPSFGNGQGFVTLELQRADDVHLR